MTANFPIAVSPQKAATFHSWPLPLMLILAKVYQPKFMLVHLIPSCLFLFSFFLFSRKGRKPERAKFTDKNVVIIPTTRTFRLLCLSVSFMQMNVRNNVHFPFQRPLTQIGYICGEMEDLPEIPTVMNNNKGAFARWCLHALCCEISKTG